jgi:hypothetical protein
MKSTPIPKSSSGRRVALTIGVLLLAGLSLTGSKPTPRSETFPADPLSDPPGRLSRAAAVEVRSASLMPGGSLGGPALSPAPGLSASQPRAQALASPSGFISPRALAQILALQKEKEERTALQRKIDSQLLFAGKASRNEPVAEGIEKIEVDLDHDVAGRVMVDLEADVSEELLATIEAAGGKVFNSFAEYRSIRAALPLTELESLSSRNDVEFISPAARAERNTGSVNSEGDVAEGANTARASFNATGVGVKVGVLSDSVDFMAQSQASGDLGNVTVLPGQSGVPDSGEGTAMLEIVHDIAPGAELYYATAFGSPAGFANNIRQLRAAGCHVIIDDVGYFNESPFQDDIIAQAVNQVTAEGALFFSSAGNSGNKNDNQSGVWEGDFSDGGQVVVPLPGHGRLHSFGGVNYNEVADGGSSRRVDLFWADPIGRASNDYDLYVLDAAGANVVSASNNTQDGTQNPYEFLNKVEVGQRIVVVQYSGENRYLQLSTGRARLAVSTGGQVRGHNSAVDAFCVAAVSAANATTPFTAAAKVEQFSSDGLRRIFFNVDGSPITPGNFSSTGGTLRQKPDIAAADGVRTTLPANSGLNPFFGTSAAAPHAGAIAALLKSLHPELTPTQARSLLASGTLDIEAGGVDRDAGYGLVMANLVLQAATRTQPPTLTGFTPTAGAPGTWITITGTKLTGATSVRFKDVSTDFIVDSATQIRALVPEGATTGPLTVTTPEGAATSVNNFTVLTSPTIAGFTPTSGSVGIRVTITGANLQGATGVSFGGVTATQFTVDSPTQISATVPAGAATGKINVTTPNGVAQSAGVFTLTTAPVIAGFSPDTAGIGATVTISGANFTGATSVRFNGTAATAFTVNSATQITTTVPTGATTGALSITTPAGTTQSATAFTVAVPPAITSFTPLSGVAGSVVTIRGSGFLGATAVKFNGVSAPIFHLDSAIQITATTPANLTTGSIQVTAPGGTASSAVPFTLQTAPANDAFAAAQNLSGPNGSVSGNNSGATKEAQEPNHAGNPGGRSVWYRWIAPTAGAWTFDTLGSAFDTLLAVYSGTSVSTLTPLAYSDDIAAGVNTNSRLTFTAIGGTTYYFAVDGYWGGPQSANPPASGSVVLNWAPDITLPAITGFSPGTGAVGAQVTITGANFLGATAVKFNGVSSAFTVASATQINATVPPVASSGPITVSTPGGTATSAAAFNVLTVVGNDLFANAYALPGDAGTTNCSNLTATKETGEPAHAGNPGGRSVWFTWVAPADGVWTFDTSGSTFDTVMGVYTGSVVGNLTAVGNNDDWTGTKTSQVAFRATLGTRYGIAVDGYGGVGGTVVLNCHFTPRVPVIANFTPAEGPVGTTVLINGANLDGAIGVSFNGVAAQGFVSVSPAQISVPVPVAASTGPILVTTSNGVARSAASFLLTGGAPANDSFANRVPLSGQSASTLGSNRNATKEAGEPNHAGLAGGSSVWWTWTAPISGTFSISTRGSDFDTILAVYTGSNLATLTPVAANDDGPAMGADSLVSFNAVAGTPYQIAVDGFNQDSGRLLLSIYPSTTSTTLYSTAFELAEGFNSTSALAGQGGWTSLGVGQNGILLNAFAGMGQQGYLGYGTTADGVNTYLWKPLNYSPDTNTRPVVTFSVDMKIVDSGNFLYDDFGWDVFNRNGDRLFFLDFDNFRMKVYYRLNDSTTYYDTGWTFEDGQVYHLVVNMDFARDRWSATVDGTTLVQGQPISAANNVGLDLGDIDAVWLQSSGLAGDNYLVFDNYSVTAGSSQLPRIVTGPANQTAAAGAAASFFVAVDSPIDVAYQWQFNGANIPGAEQPTLSLNNLALNQAGAYSVVVSNAAGAVTSTPATLLVTALPNLTPYKPSAWSDKIIVSTVPGATNDIGTISTSDDVYITWAVANLSSGGDVGGRFYTELYVDGALSHVWATDGLNAGVYVFVKGYGLGKLTAGTHSLRLVTDSSGIVSESDETDNSYTRTMVVNATAGQSPRLTAPELSATTGLNFSFTGLPSRSYQVQTSTNLTDWTVFTTLANTNADQIVRVSDPSAIAGTRRFYRVHLLP